jgi:hypothetical protein
MHGTTVKIMEYKIQACMKKSQLQLWYFLGLKTYYQYCYTAIMEWVYELSLSSLSPEYVHDVENDVGLIYLKLKLT